MLARQPQRTISGGEQARSGEGVNRLAPEGGAGAFAIVNDAAVHRQRAVLAEAFRLLLHDAPAAIRLATGGAKGFLRAPTNVNG
jgi:hypothetical protein